MTSTATLEDDGSTLYRTDSFQEFKEAVAAARDEGAKITVQSTGNGFAAKIRYPEGSESGAAQPEPDEDEGDELDVESILKGNVDQVNHYLDEHPDHAEAVLAAEAEGQKRKMILEGPHAVVEDLIGDDSSS